MRSRILLAGLLAAAALPGGAAQAAAPTLYSSYDFLGDRSASYSFSALTETLGTEGTPTFGDADVNGLVRPVGRTGTGSGFVASGTSTNLTSAYTIAMAIDVADEWTEQRILSLRGKASTVALWMREGRLEYRGSGGTVRSDKDFPADFAQLVFTRTADHVISVYVGNELHLTLTDAPADGSVASIRVGNVEATATGSLDIARLRIGKGAMTGPEVAALAAYDTVGPSVSKIDLPDAVGDVRYVGPSSSWNLLISDDGEGDGMPYETHVETADGELVGGTSDTGETGWATFGGDSTFGDAHSGVYRENTRGALTHGAEYEMVVDVTDGHGHAGTTRVPFVADTVAPPLTVDAIPARVTSHEPVFSGAAGEAVNDAEFVELAVCGGDGCAIERRRGVFGGGEIAWADVDVIDGRWQSGPVTMYDEDTGEPIPFPDGRYTLRVTQWDSAGNRTSLERPFEIGPPLPVEDDRDERPQGGSTPPPVVPTPPAPGPAPTQTPTPRAVTTTPSERSVLDQLAGRIVSALGAKGLKGLGKGVGLRLAPVRPGAVAVKVLDARKKRTLASGTLKGGKLTVKLTRAGRRAVRGKRRVSVVVRTTFGRLSSDRKLTLRR